MNGNKINELLERYYEALTTEAEEQELKRYFESEDVPAQLQAEKEMFLQLQQMAQTDMPQSLEERLSASIDRWDAEERQTIRMPEKKRMPAIGRWAGSIAAGIAVLMAFGWYIYGQEPERKDTCATPEEAYRETQRALAMFTDAMNRGVNQMEAARTTTKKIEKSIQKQFNRIND